MFGKRVTALRRKCVLAASSACTFAFITCDWYDWRDVEDTFAGATLDAFGGFVEGTVSFLLETLIPLGG